jgi:hypothetical protein
LRQARAEDPPDDRQRIELSVALPELEETAADGVKVRITV